MQGCREEDDLDCAPRFTGCGTQHPLRALGGTRVLLAAAPTTPPCFRHWRRSSSLLTMFSGKSIFICSSETPAGVSELLFHGRGVAWNGICCKNLRFASCKKGLLRGAAAPEGYVIAAQTSKLGSSFSMWMLDIKALCSGSVNSASFTYLFSTAAVRTGSAMVPAPPMQPPGQPIPSSR